MQSSKVTRKIRHYKGDGSTVEVTMTRAGAMRYMCQECVGWDFPPWECGDNLCPLYPWRPRTAKPTYDRPKVVMSLEQKTKAIARLKKGREQGRNTVKGPQKRTIFPGKGG
jgi:hypothetical protein